LLYENYDEWGKAEKFKRKLAFKIKEFHKLKDITNINDLLEILNNIGSYEALGKYIKNDKIPIIIIKESHVQILPYITLISEYNHHLIDLILNENKQIFKKNFLDFNYYLFEFLIDEGISNYLGIYLYLLSFQKSVDNFLYLEKYYLTSNEYDKFILENAKKQYLPILINNKITFENLININKDIFDYYYDNFLKYNIISVYFLTYLKNRYGMKKFYEFLYNVYNLNYNNIDQIFKKTYNCSIKNILVEIDNTFK
jgi:hypothetical protein